MPFGFHFSTFASAVTNYFLPWLALTAQLPFETGDPWNDVMAFCLAVGSPALVTYSLTITILNRFWVRETFSQLSTRARAESIQQKYGRISQRIKAAQYLLQEAQQVPLRASQEKGWLSSLLVIPDNAGWWNDLHDRLKDTRRGITASLVAQMFLAAIAYLFTIISAYQKALGDPSTALQIASGSMWIWLIPVILGWITVGTQSRPDTIETALCKEQAYRALEQTVIVNNVLNARSEQRGLVVRSGLTPQPHRAQTSVGGLDPPDPANLQVPTWCGADVLGDEQHKGPIYNYTRVFTWWNVAITVEQALRGTLNNIAEGETCDSMGRTNTSALNAANSGPASQPAGSVPLQSNLSQAAPPNTHNAAGPSTPLHPPQVPRIGIAWNITRGEANLTGDIEQTAKYCGLQPRRILAYPTWRGDSSSHVTAPVYRRIFVASCAAIFLQWGTTGASIIIAYLTPTIGLGCRSGSYVLYGVLGTVSWLCLLLGMLLSHKVMVMYQTVHVDNPSMDFRSSKQLENLHLTGFGFSIVRAGAVSFRYVGKSLAVGNTIWLILTSLLQFVGAYDNCWCQGNVLGLGKDDGWVVLFKDASELSDRAGLPWGGGLAMTLIVCVSSYIFFALGSLKSEDNS